MEDVMRDFFVQMKQVFQADVNEFVDSDSMVDDRCLLELLSQLMNWLQESDHKHWKILD
jgi:hypothetical protein